MTGSVPRPTERQPRRIQLRRTKGWRKPEGVVIVSRPRAWSNPFAVTHCDAVHVPYRHWHVYDVDKPGRWLDSFATKTEAIDRAVALFREWADLWEWEIRADLAGKDLACWCPLDQPCHADVLLELANV